VVSSILDSSALLAYLRSEPGYEVVDNAIEKGAAISAINFSEVAAVMIRDGQKPATVKSQLSGLELSVLPLEEDVAFGAAELVILTKPYGLSLGDRICFAMAKSLKVPTITADKPWAKIAKEIGVDIKLIR
jgi:PIN domain nuclease of toxin-antitoxin system